MNIVLLCALCARGQETIEIPTKNTAQLIHFECATAVLTVVPERFETRSPGGVIRVFLNEQMTANSYRALPEIVIFCYLLLLFFLTFV